MPLIYVRNEHLWSVAELFGFIFIQEFSKTHFAFSTNRLGKRELTRYGIPYREFKP